MKKLVIPLTLFACHLAFADKIILKNGETLEGDFFGADSQQIRFVVKGQIVYVQVNEVTAIQFADPTGVAASKAAQPCPDQPPAASVSQPETNTARKIVVPSIAEPKPPPAAETEPEAAATKQPEPSGGTVTVPAGAVLRVRLLEQVNLDRDEIGSTYRAVLHKPVTPEEAEAGGEPVIPGGAEVALRLAEHRQTDDLKKNTLTTGLEAVALIYHDRRIAIHTGKGIRRGRSNKERASEGLSKAASTLGRVFGGMVGQQAGDAGGETAEDTWGGGAVLRPGSELEFVLTEAVAVSWPLQPGPEPEKKSEAGAPSRPTLSQR